MKRIVIALLLVLIASSAAAQSISDIQNGLIPENTVVQLQNVTVTAARNNGFFVAEAPYGPYNGIWIYSAADLGFVPGDIVNIIGEYYEYFGLSEVDVTVVGALVAGAGTGPVPAPYEVPAAVYAADGEPFESCLIKLTDMLTVTALLDFGEWTEETMDSTEILFDDYFFDETSLTVGDCHLSATGIPVFSFGAFKIEALADGLPACPVGVEETTFGTLKSLYR
jgi:hypothetical protein